MTRSGQLTPREAVIGHPPTVHGDDQLRRALAAADAGAWEWDATDDVVRCSPQLRHLLGHDGSDLRTDLDLFDAIGDAAMRAGLKGAFQAALAHDDRVTLDVRIVRPDGEIRWLRVFGDVERDSLGAARHAVGIAMDVTGQKRLQQRLMVADGVSRILATATSMDEAAPQILAAIAEGTGMEICGLWMPLPDGQLLRCQYVHAVEPAKERFAAFLEQTLVTRLAPGEGLVGRVWQSREALWVESVAREHGFEGARASFVAGLESGVAIPLISGLALLGVVDVFSSHPAPSDPLLLDTLAGLGNELGQFILRMRAEASLRESDEGQRLLVRLLQEHRESDDPDAIMREAEAALGEHLQADRVGFLGVSHDVARTIHPAWNAPGSASLPDPWAAKDSPGVDVARMREGQAVVIADMTLDRLTAGRPSDRYGIRAALAIPILRGGHWSAMLYVHQQEPRRWSPSDVSLAREVAEHTWDAVERARAEAARRESESLARTIGENSTHALVMTDARGHVRYSNAAFLEMTGLDPGIVPSKPLHELIHHHRPNGEPYPVAACPIAQAMSERDAMREHEDVFFRSDGRAFPVLCAVSPLSRNGRHDATMIEIRDVSATHAAAEALRASEQRFRATFETAAVGMAHVAVDGRWLQVNDKLCQIVGYDEVELLERRFQDITHPEDLAADEALARRVLAGEIETYSLEKRYVRKDGEPIWIGLTVSLVRTPNGEPDYFIAIVVDIATRKLAEGRLHSALAAKDEFLGFVSHELRTPMTVILGMSQVLTGERLAPERVREIALDIASSAHELNELIESMLLLARVDSVGELANEPLLLARAAAESIDRQRQRDRARRYQLESCADSLVHAHPGLVERVISNLLSNAAKYSVADGQVDIVVSREETEVSLRVLDQGPGLDDAELKEIFEPFYRTNGARGAPGLGLGLTVAKRIVEALGGRMWVQRRDPIGSEFGFALPRMDPDEE